MAWVAVDKDKTESIFPDKPQRIFSRDLYWKAIGGILLPEGSIKKLIGKELSWDDEPFELKED